MQGAPQNQYPLYGARVWQMGKSVVFPLYATLREVLNIKPGDLVLVRVHPPYVTFRLAHPEKSIPVTTFGEDELPPPWPAKSKPQPERDK